MAAIKTVKGDATTPSGVGNKFIVHICNDMGGWGKGFVVAISRRWKEPEAQFRAWYKNGEGFELGAVQLVKVTDDTFVANMIGQHNIYNAADGTPPIRYEALSTALGKVCELAKEYQASVHMPRIGAGLAGGDWAKITAIIDEKLCQHGVDVTVYEF